MRREGAEFSVGGKGGGCGCVTLVAGCLFVWALLFGVTIGDKHYGLSGCDCNGVHIDKGAP